MHHKRGPAQSGYVGSPPRGLNKGKKLKGAQISPWTQLVILHRLACGEPMVDLACQYGISTATIARWSKLWMHEAAFVRAALNLKDIGDLRLVVTRLQRSVERSAKEIDTMQARVRHKFDRQAKPKQMPVLPGELIPEAVWDPEGNHGRADEKN